MAVREYRDVAGLNGNWGLPALDQALALNQDVEE
jgi:hypothetical protein